jgi:hypothetical protein
MIVARVPPAIPTTPPMRASAHLRRTLDRLTPPQQDALITGIETLTEEMARDRI